MRVACEGSTHTHDIAYERYRMSFRSHLENITTKATRMLNFLRRNLYRCNQEVKCMACTHLVRPMLEFASCVWDPYFNKDINALEMIGRRAARWVTSNYDWRSGNSISSTLGDLQWQSLAQIKDKHQGLNYFFKAIHHTSGLKIPDHYNQETLVQSIRSYHHLHFSIPFINTN